MKDVTYKFGWADSLTSISDSEHVIVVSTHVETFHKKYLEKEEEKEKKEKRTKMG